MVIRVPRTLLILVSLFLGCGPGVVSGAIDLTEYTPLRVGARWEYVTSYSHPSTGSGTAVSTEEVVGLEELGGRNYYKSVWFTDGFPGARPLTTFLHLSSFLSLASTGVQRRSGERGTMSKKSWLVAVLCAVVFAAVSASSAFAGEVTGKGDATGAPEHANSICAFSGQNDDPEAPGAEGGRVQSWGQDVKEAVHAGNPPPGGVPGQACRGGSN